LQLTNDVGVENSGIGTGTVVGCSRPRPVVIVLVLYRLEHWIDRYDARPQHQRRFQYLTEWIGTLWLYMSAVYNESSKVIVSYTLFRPLMYIIASIV